MDRARARRRRRTAGQEPHQPGVDGAEGELAALGRGTRAARVVEQPGELGSGEVGVEDEPGALAKERLEAARLQHVARRRGAPVLPDDGVADRLAGRAVPDDRRLALVGDAERGDVGGAETGLRPAPRVRSPAASCQISRGSCSTQPGCGKIWRNSCCARRRRCRARRRRSRASSTCPGRGREDEWRVSASRRSSSWPDAPAEGQCKNSRDARALHRCHRTGRRHRAHRCRRAGRRRRRQRCRHRTRSRRSRRQGRAVREGRPRRAHLVGIDQADPRRPALSRVPRVRAGAQGARRARGAAQERASHHVAACASSCRTIRRCGPCG